MVRKILASTGGRVGDLIGNTAVLRGLSPAAFTDDTFGLPTVTDILAELEKPGRDPRPAFATAVFADGVEKIADLRVGMVLEGVVTNVAAFGAFVDVGVHQDGLVHVSAMSRKFVSDPREVVTSGQVVKVKVMEVDEARKRISLTPAAGRRAGRPGRRGPPERPMAAGTGGTRPDRQGAAASAGAVGRDRPGRPAPAAPWPRRCAGPAWDVARRQHRRALRQPAPPRPARSRRDALRRGAESCRPAVDRFVEGLTGDRRFCDPANSAVVVAVARSVAAPARRRVRCATDPAHGTAYQELIHFRPAVQAAATCTAESQLALPELPEVGNDRCRPVRLGRCPRAGGCWCRTSSTRPSKYPPAVAISVADTARPSSVRGPPGSSIARSSAAGE